MQTLPRDSASGETATHTYKQLRTSPSAEPDAELSRHCQQALDDDRLIICVGAGVSRQVAGLPSWPEMIENLIAKAIQRSDRRAYESFNNIQEQDDYLVIPRLPFIEEDGLRCKLINYILDVHKARGGDLDGPASSARQALSSEEFKAWLREMFSTEARRVSTGEIYNHKLMVSLRAWQYLKPRFMTTNYDDVLEFGLAANSSSKLTTLSQLSHRPDVDRAWTPGGSHIYHLHGSHDDPPSIVFAPSEYENIGQDDFLSDILKNNTVLFIGCGRTLTDRHFSRLLKEAHSGTARHFSLTLNRDDSIPSSVKQVIFGTTHDQLAAYLAKIAGKVEFQQIISSLVTDRVIHGPAIERNISY